MKTETVAMIIILALAAIPWIWNAVKLTNCDFDAPYRCEVVHGIGLTVPPSSIITVWFDDDE